jgi:hypothetical protein
LPGKKVSHQRLREGAAQQAKESEEKGERGMSGIDERRREVERGRGDWEARVPMI